MLNENRQNAPHENGDGICHQVSDEARDVKDVKKVDRDKAVNNIRKYFWLIPGFICLVLGTLGTVFPILPTVPFYLATLVCFAKGSNKLHEWFIGTNLYHKHLETFVNKKTMPLKTKITILSGVTLLMTIGFVMMKGMLIGRIVLAVVWLAHIVYFIFYIKTEKCISDTLSGEIQTRRSGND